MGYGDQMTIGPYELVCRSYTQEENPNYGSEWAIIDVQREGKHITTLYPERRFYRASQQPQDIAADLSDVEAGFPDGARPLFGLRRAKSGYTAANHKGTFESAGAVDLDWLAHHGAGYNFLPGARTHAGTGDCAGPRGTCRRGGD